MQPKHHTEPHVSLVHDFFIAWGGAEMTFDAITQAFPNNTLYAAFDHPETRHEPLDKAEIHTTFLNKFPFTRTYLLEIYKFLLPLAFSNLRFNDKTNLIISDTASFAKHLIPPPGVRHISYIHTPPRFLWNMPPSKKVRANLFLRFMWNLLFGSAFRVADYLHAQRVHGIIANSEETASRIRKYYRREPLAVINPPVYVKKFAQTIENKVIDIKKEFLAFGRIEPYKNFDKLVKVWPEGYKLTICGVGSQVEEVKRLAKGNPNITFINRYVPDSEKPELFASFSGFLYPNIEDFGIMMVEALSVGTPVISYDTGGGKEIVSHKESGYLLQDLTTTNLVKALDWSLSLQRDDQQKKAFYNNMVKYDIESFITKIRAVAEKFLNGNETLTQ